MNDERSASSIEPRTSNFEPRSSYVVRRTKQRSLFILCLLVLLTGLAYAPSLRNEFVYDDRVLIRENKLLRQLSSIPQLFVTDWWKGVEQEIGRVASGADGESSSGDRRYRPLAAVTYVLNYVIGGPAPWGYHLVNLLLHAGASFLLYLLAVELGWTVGAAALAAVIFAVHPLHTEAVTWIVGRPELLMGVFVFGSLWCEVVGYRALALVSFALALLSKEQAVVLPVLLVLVDACRSADIRYTRLSSGWRPILRRYGPYAAVLGLYLGMRTAVMGGFLPPVYPFLENPLEHVKGVPWALTVLKLAGHYLWLSVWPAALSADYSYNSIPVAADAAEPAVLWALVAWSGLIILAIWGWRRERRLTLAVGVTVVTFAPVANILVPVGTPMAERLFYLPLAGLCLLAGVGYERLLARLRSRFRLRERSSLNLSLNLNLIVQAVIVALCLALTIRTIIRVQDWKSNETLFTSVISIFPQNAKAHSVLGDEFMAMKSRESLVQAMVHYRRALALYPDYLTTHAVFASNFGSVLLDLGYKDEALAAMKLAVGASPLWSKAHFNLGLVYAKNGDYDRSEEAWKRALALAPQDPQIHSSLSRLFIERGRYVEALEAAETALSKDPEFVMAAYNRALALQSLGRRDEAVDAYEGVLLMRNAPEEARQDVLRKLSDLRGSRSPGKPATQPCTPGLVGC